MNALNIDQVWFLKVVRFELNLAFRYRHCAIIFIQSTRVKLDGTVEVIINEIYFGMTDTYRLDFFGPNLHANLSLHSWLKFDGVFPSYEYLSISGVQFNLR